MANKFVIFGVSGQYRVMKQIIDSYNTEHHRSEVFALLDESNGIFIGDCKKVKFYNGSNALEQFDKDALQEIYRESCENNNNYYSVVAIGNPHSERREELYELLKERRITPYTLIHKSAILEKSSWVKLGCQIHMGAKIGAGTVVGNYSIINTGAIVDHDCKLGTGVEIGPGATVCGEVEIGDYTWICAGATIKDKVKIGKNVIVGAGAVVINDIPDDLTVVGIPARPLKRTIHYDGEQ